MYKRSIFQFLLSSVLIIGTCEGVLQQNEELRKPNYTPGIKTTNWKSSYDFKTHENYSKVLVQNNPSIGGHYTVTQTEKTQRLYPVYYNGHSYGQRPENHQNVFDVTAHPGVDSGGYSSKNRTIYKRKIESKTLDVYEKCPPDETGQFVYHLSCNQFLNCWKGRGVPQNCAPGTLFNPRTLECDFPDKVECITGPRQNTLINIRVQKSVKQAYCPNEFSGLIPNYTDCSKFISCNNGQSVSMDCPPGTLFDINQNVCNFPHKCVCFNGQSGAQNQHLVQLQAGQYYQTSYDQTQDCSALNSNCRNRVTGTQNKLSQNSQTDSYQYHQTNYDRKPSVNQLNGQQFYQTQYGTAQKKFDQNSGSGSGSRFITDQQSTHTNVNFGQVGSADRYNPGRELPAGGDQLRYGQFSCIPGTQNCHQSVETTRQNTFSQIRPKIDGIYCDSRTQNCRGQSRYDQSPIYDQTIIQGQGQGSISTQSIGANNMYPSRNCNPLIQNCRPNIRGHQSTSYTQSAGHTQSSSQNNCDLSGQNCGQNSGQAFGPSVGQSNINFGGTNANCDPSNQNCGQGGYGSQYELSAGQTYTENNRNLVRNLNSGQNYAHRPITIHSNFASQNPCNPLIENCGNRPTSHNFKPTDSTGQNFNEICNINDPNCFPSHTVTTKNTRSREVRCPDGYQGITKHPSDCKKFLNCANGQTFVQDCAPGTLFNPTIGNCDFPYNVVCEYSEVPVTESYTNIYEEDDIKHEQKYGRNTGHGNIRVETTEANVNKGSYDQWRAITSHSYNVNTVTETNRGQIGILNRPIHSQIDRTNSNNQNLDQLRDKYPDYVDVFNPKEQKNIGLGSTTPRSVWPPPFSSTDTDADYVYEYENGEPVTLESVEVFYADKDMKPVCEQGDFHCSASTCITKTMVCDGHRDCDNSKDELGCEEYIGRFTVLKNHQLDVLEKQRWVNITYTTCAMLCLENTKFNCRSFNYRKIDRTCFLSDANVGLTGALRQYFPCDYYELKTGTLDCSDRSRYWECPNKKCISTRLRCDGLDDCGDRQDEKNCKPEDFGYSIKLAGSHESNKGRVEITAFGKTGYICDDQFGIKDANVVCRELGFQLGAAEVKGQSYFARTIKENNTLYMMDDVDCFGNETTIMNCGFSGWGVHDCRDQEIAGVVCKTLQEKCGKGYWKCDSGNECVPLSFLCDDVYDCTDDSDEGSQHCYAPTEIRLVNGSNVNEGRVEIKHHGIWGTICDDDFNEDAAKVVCRYFGFQGNAAVKKDAYFGSGEGPIWLDQVSCYGNETKLETCTHWDWGEHNCDHGEDVGVICNQEEEVEVQRHSKLSGVFQNSEGLPSTCGFRKDNQFLENDLIHARVVSGALAKKGDYPWQAALRVKVKEKSAHWCGAVIVASKWVLTAAHCLQGYTKGAYIVVAGEYNTDEEEGTEQQKYIEEFFIHDGFRKGHKMNNDIALIRVKGLGFNLNDDIQPICLPDVNADYEQAMNCTISGFGSVKSGTSAYSHNMMAAWIPIHSSEICKMPHIYGNALTDGMVCAGFLDGGVDACDGDSGGPLACLDQGLFTLYGLTSWGQHCGYANKPGVYVKVAHYRKWIDEIIKRHSH